MQFNLRIWGYIAALVLNSVIVLTVAEGNLEILILHHNDVHARFEQTSRLSGSCTPAERDAVHCYGGIARVATVVKEAREATEAEDGPPVLYLTAGDTYTGSVWFSIYQWTLASSLMNMLEPDAVSLGNHEFDDADTATGLSQLFHSLKSPVVAANIAIHHRLPSHLTWPPPLIKESTVVDIGDRKVGIIGYLTPDTRYLPKSIDVEPVDEVEAIREEAQKLITEGVNILIALGHSGPETDIRIATEVAEVDLVISGHTNSFLWNGTTAGDDDVQNFYPTMIRQESGKIVPVIQTHAYTKYLGRLLVEFDNEGNLIVESNDSGIISEPILLDDSVEKDDEVLKKLDDFNPDVEGILSEMVGRTVVLLQGGNECKLRECNLGNLITDSMVYYSSLGYEGDTGWTDTPVALLQGSGIPFSISTPDGDIIKADILTSIPFDNAVTKVNVSGETLLSALERSVFDYDQQDGTGAFLQMSGIRVTYDLSGPPGSRVDSALVRCGQCYIPEFHPVQPERWYDILITSFLARGGDGYDMFREDAINVELKTFDEVQTLSDYIKRRSPVYPEVAARITLQGQVNNADKRN